MLKRSRARSSFKETKCCVSSAKSTSRFSRAVSHCVCVSLSVCCVRREKQYDTCSRSSLFPFFSVSSSSCFFVSFVKVVVSFLLLEGFSLGSLSVLLRNTYSFFYGDGEAKLSERRSKARKNERQRGNGVALISSQQNRRRETEKRKEIRFSEKGKGKQERELGTRGRRKGE